MKKATQSLFCGLLLLSLACTSQDDDDTGGGGNTTSSSQGQVGSSGDTSGSSSGGGTSGAVSGSGGTTSSPATSGTSVTGDGGVFTPCQDPTECPGTDTTCRTRTCEQQRCGMVYIPYGISAGEQVIGDCHKLVCDGQGEVMAVVDKTDLPDDHNDCTEDVCLDDGQAVHPNLVDGTVCHTTPGVFCDGEGHCVQCKRGSDCPSGVCDQFQCVAPTCLDGVRNGTETDKDCGGGDCHTCGPNMHCNQHEDCRGGVCTSNACVPTCTDDVTNGYETDMDCGGPDCEKCPPGSGCILGLDCDTGACGTDRKCLPPICGDGQINASTEQCDDGNTNNEPCAYGVSACVICGSECKRIPGAISYCGDNKTNGPETCDDGNTITEPCTYGESSCLVCAADCVTRAGVATWCGDHVKQTDHEDCDDGNTVTETCSYGETQCTVCDGTCHEVQGATAYCGNGTINEPNEDCDDSNTTTETCTYGLTSCTVCNSTCHQAPGAVAYCGDNSIQGDHENCDDGNALTEACPYGTPDCTVCDETCHTAAGAVAVCGDSKTTPPDENCDDGNITTEPCDYGLTSCQVCDATCHTVAGATAYCGDSTPQSGHEDCDDGNTVTEECPYGNRTGCTVCNSTCHNQAGITSFCGDGQTQSPETCDDANNDTEVCDYGLTSCEVCSATCVEQAGATSYCGDRLVDIAHEDCDDGNAVGGDCCSAQCEREAGCEVEPNDTKAQALATNVVFAQAGIIKGNIVTAGDVDYLPIQITQTIDLKVEAFQGSTPGQCPSADTFVEFMDTDGTTLLASDNDDGPNECSLLDPTVDTGIRALIPGTYFLVMHEFGNNGTVPVWGVRLTVMATCGNGTKEGSEQCDDNNLENGDSCSDRCRMEYDWESEPNNVCADADGPLALPRPLLAAGSIDPVGDQDWWKFSLATAADVKIETFDATGPSSCNNIDPSIRLYAADCTTTLGPERNNTPNPCPVIDPSMHTEARHLLPGTYCLRMHYNDDTRIIPGYTIRFSLTATCGNGTKEGYEECDGTAGCDANCDRIPFCSDGFIDAPEQCDDGNTTPGDGCSATCQDEPGKDCGDGTKWPSEDCDDGNLAVGDGCNASCKTETVINAIEPNNTLAQADATGIVLTGPNTIVKDSIDTTTDAADYHKLQLAADSVVRMEVFDSSGKDCVGIDPYLSLRNTSDIEILWDKGDGIYLCPALTKFLTAGVYYIKINRTTLASTFSYILEVKIIPNGGDEIEPNSSRAESTLIQQTESFMWGSHQTNPDDDYYVVHVPAARALRVELIEGDSETCETGGIDSKIWVYNSIGVELTNNDDKPGSTTSNYCSLVDGSGTSPKNSALRNLAEGDYFIRVAASGLASSGGALFDYRIVVTIR